MKVKPDKPGRAHIDLNDKVAMRGWVKQLGKSKEEIAAIIEKVGPNAETVRKEIERWRRGEDQPAPRARRVPVEKP
jgi:hypothetical protein